MRSMLSTRHYHRDAFVACSLCLSFLFLFPLSVSPSLPLSLSLSLFLIPQQAFKRNERDHVIWAAKTPPEKGATIAYFSDAAGAPCQCASWIQWKCCPFCVKTIDYRFTKQGRSKEGNLPTEILLEDTDGLRRPP